MATFTRTNRRYNATAMDGEARFQRLNLLPETMEDPYYVDPHIAGQMFFTHTEVHLDGQEITTGNKETGSHGHLFQRAHRIACPDEMRIAKYGEKSVWIANSEEMDYTLPVRRSGDDPVSGGY